MAVGESIVTDPFADGAIGIDIVISMIVVPIDIIMIVIPVSARLDGSRGHSRSITATTWGTSSVRKDTVGAQH
ncbi:Uu.00g085380.m01.CDS01 [Anthostomella pinea]|uniref:Uu.00g085380.m01.CDS01 n=1 Tax=Anthostomella pinea TaxID=933095 RepID=A0AAI8YJT9_9PEZI|nr:Uu.00g085380.m01.CDS01 [Anthostomella pinea]